MQHPPSHKQAHQTKARAHTLLPLAGLTGFLVMVALIPHWRPAWAAQHSGANTPDLNIVALSHNTITLLGHNWEANSTVTLSYSTSTRCQPATSLKSPNNIAFVNDQSTFQVNYPWPASITGGPFYFCASGRSADHTSAPGIYTPQAIIVDAQGTVSFAPGSAPTPAPTSTLPPTNTPATPATATTQSATATTTPQATPPTAPPATATTQPSSPATKAASASNKPTASLIATLAAILTLCFLVFLLLIYLIRIWLQGRNTP